METSPTLGELTAVNEFRRDALHIATISATAVQRLSPGQHVGWTSSETARQAGPAKRNVGIVDPFLKNDVEPGQRFWLCLYPGSITSLRHVWGHPSFNKPNHDSVPSMHDDEACLLAILQDDEDDTKTRSVYSDWLNEQGRHEEAERQRNWPDAKQWLKNVCSLSTWGPPDGYWKLSYEHLLQAAKEGLECKYVDCVADMNLCDRLREDPVTFWMNWSIVTGIRLPEGFEPKNAPFSCSC